ncbi:MAG: hypothetical protein AABY07_05015 [Nanoarchaeota archaeon]
MQYLAKGKRGMVFLAKLNNVLVAIKTKRPDSKALNSINNESYWLNRLNKHGIGPKLIDYGENYLAMEYVKGIRFVDYFKETKNKKKLNKIIKDIFNQCYKLDKLNVNKYEMHNPVKHIIIRKDKAVLIDFERCKKSRKPKNVTQFCQFLLKLGFKIDRNELIGLLKSYKGSYSIKNFDNLCKLFSL